MLKKCRTCRHGRQVLQNTNMIVVHVKAIGMLAEQAPDGTRVSLPQEAHLQDLLNSLNIKTEEVMLAFINGKLAGPSSPLTPECQVYLSPFICGG